MKRRVLLQTSGVLTILVAAGGVWRANDQGVFRVGDGPAYEPWKDWRDHPGEGTLAFVRAAILAASPHNSQPWRFKVAPDWIELYIDTNRNVGALDPYLREEHIGIGCALENMLLAAAANGFQGTATLASGKIESDAADSGSKLAARVEFVAAQPEPSALYDAISMRHTNRGAYDQQRPLPAEFTHRLLGLASQESVVKLSVFTEEADRDKIVAISAAANTELYADPEVDRGSNRWIRFDWGSVQEQADGLTLDTFGLPPMAAALAKTLPRRLLRWTATQGALGDYAKLMSSAPLIGVISVRDRYDKESCLRAGRIWQRAHLLATSLGVAGRPCNEAIEMIDHERAHNQPPLRLAQLAAILGTDAWQPTFLFYMGYPLLPARASPRRALERVRL